MEKEKPTTEVKSDLVRGYVVWREGRHTRYRYYPVVEWTPNEDSWAGWEAMSLENHPFAEELKALGMWAGQDTAQEDPAEFTVEFTFPREWTRGAKDVKRQQRPRD